MEIKASTKRRLNSILRHMRQRCKNPNNDAFKNYGAKGIKVCKEWDENYLNFYEWALQNGYQDDLTIDRVDSSRDYEPGNCEWVTREENCRRAHKGKLDNQSRMITFNGKTQSMTQWAAELGIKFKTLEARINWKKWPIERALTEPVRAKKPAKRK